jgi:excisionase family DNA binding protein
MDDETTLPDLQDYISVKDAAKMLGLSYKTVYEYITEGRIKAFRASNFILVPREEVIKFKSGISGRPRTSVPLWRISPEDNTLSQISILVKIREGKLNNFRHRLDEIRRKKEHLFPGTIARYILGSDEQPELVEMIFIWRSSVMPDEDSRQQALEAFKASLEDVLDWDTARYSNGPVYMHA